MCKLAKSYAYWIQIVVSLPGTADQTSEHARCKKFLVNFHLIIEMQCVEIEKHDAGITDSYSTSFVSFFPPENILKPPYISKAQPDRETITNCQEKYIIQFLNEDMYIEYSIIQYKHVHLNIALYII